jgi:hypothetical protein
LIATGLAAVPDAPTTVNGADTHSGQIEAPT